VSFKKDLINLRLTIEYDGKNYFGWQRQKSKPSIQQTIEKSLQVLFPGEKIKLIGAGRTDTGVHAYAQTANFKIRKKSFEKYGKSKLVYSLNAILPDDISIRKLSTAKDDFHARYSAKSRVYKYCLCTEKHAIERDKCYNIKTKFDIDLAKEFCKLLSGVHSFKGLCKNKTDEHGFLCKVKYAKLKKLRTGIIEFEICASRFLHSMVRAIAGTMIKIASKKLSIKEFQQKFKKGEEIRIQYVPANALFLAKVNY
jgi:tRNA pseudouridine38-40 synthase